MGSCQWMRVYAAVPAASFCSSPAVPPEGFLPQSPLSLTSASLQIPWEGQINNSYYTEMRSCIPHHAARKNTHTLLHRVGVEDMHVGEEERRGRTLVFVLSPLVVSAGTYAWYCWCLGPAGILSIVSVAALSSGHLLWLFFVESASSPEEITQD